MDPQWFDGRQPHHIASLKLEFAPMSQVPAGWYPSPDAPGQLQYWDGAAWTEFRAVAEAAAQQPVAQPVSQPVAQPVAQQPVAQPVMQQPVAQPVMQQPVAQPAVAQPAVAQPAAVAVADAGAAAAAAKRARLISFAGGFGLFVLGVVVGALLF